LRGDFDGHFLRFGVRFGDLRGHFLRFGVRFGRKRLWHKKMVFSKYSYCALSVVIVDVFLRISQSLKSSSYPHGEFQRATITLAPVYGIV